VTLRLPGAPHTARNAETPPPPSAREATILKCGHLPSPEERAPPGDNTPVPRSSQNRMAVGRQSSPETSRQGVRAQSPWHSPSVFAPWREPARAAAGRGRTQPTWPGGSRSMGIAARRSAGRSSRRRAAPRSTTHPRGHSRRSGSRPDQRPTHWLYVQWGSESWSPHRSPLPS
jgi:hypothetical protein